MTAEILRLAVQAIRDDWAEGEAHVKPAVFYRAVADWLEADALKVEQNSHAITFDGSPMFPPNPCALSVARTYLGDPS